MVTEPKQRIDRIKREINGVVSQYGVTQWELQFMESILNNPRPYITDKQNKVLRQIEIKVFGDEADDD